MPVTGATFRKLVLEDPEGHWELVCGQLRQKPGMTADHNHVATELFIALVEQLDRTVLAARMNMGHIQRIDSYFIPDVFVVPTELEKRQRGTRALEVYDKPLPLVVEVWSPSTGSYDVQTKLVEYQRRGDLEIWLVHPVEQTITAWVRQPDGSYVETVHHSGTVRPSALRDVTISVEALFD